MQPAQLSLLGGEAPLAPPLPLAHLPEADVAKALSLLAGLIAKASEEGVSADE